MLRIRLGYYSHVRQAIHPALLQAHLHHEELPLGDSCHDRHRYLLVA